ncbi:MAG: glycosyltransferase family 2 protein [Vicinamibacteraceae bacterium]
MPLTPDSWLATAAFALVAAVFVTMAAGMLHNQRWARRLPALDALPADPAATPPRASIVVAARDEAEGIEASVRNLLGQRHVSIEVIVVSDRSVDDTAAIVRRLATDDPRVRLVEVTALPERWLGKTHALHMGAAAATGDWLLFTDADCLLQPDVMARALRLAARDGVQHVALTPAPIAASTGGYAWHYVFLAGLLDWFGRANRDEPGGYLGFGAFNLVQASTYRAFGGHEPLRLTVLDDVRLGLLVRRAGGRCRGFLGGSDTRCHWGSTLGQGIRLTEKNYFAAVHYNGAIVGGLALVVALLWAGVIAGVASGTVLGFAAAGAGALLALPAIVFSRRLEWPIAGALLAPLVHSFAAYAVVRSAVLTWRRGGVQWRETFYPLAELRAGDLMVSPGAAKTSSARSG